MEEGTVSVAALFAADGSLAEVPQCRKVAFYEGGQGAWLSTGGLDFGFEGASGLCGMRKRLSEFMGAIGKRSAILAAGFPGVCRDVLSRNGYVLYETGIFEEGVLDGIAEHLREGDQEGEGVPIAPFEEEPGSGIFFLDLRLALNANPDLTTKMILRPFLQGAKFLELGFIYDHFPPWLPSELRGLGYKYECSDCKGGVSVRVYGGASCDRQES